MQIKKFNMKTNRILILTIAFFISTIQIWGQKTKANSDQYKNLENKIVLVNSKVDSLSKKVNTGNETLEQARETYSTAKEIMEIKESSIHFFYYILLILSALGAFGLFSGIALTKKYYDYKVREILKDNEKILTGLIKKHTKEKYLLGNSKILIINKKHTNIDVGLKMILNKFRNDPTIHDTEDLSDIAKDKLSAYDVVIVDNINYNEPEKNWDFSIDGTLKERLINLAVETCSKNNAFLYFGAKSKDGNFSENLHDYHHLINFANHPATLFANLIDLLDFRRLIKDQIV